MRFNCGPFAVDVMSTFILDGRQTVILHIASEEVFFILRDTGLEYENTRGDTDSEEQVLG